MDKFISKYEKEHDRLISEGVQASIDKMTPEEHENLRNNLDELMKLKPNFEETIRSLEESSYGLTKSLEDLVNSFIRIVGLGESGQKVLGLLSDGFLEKNTLIPFDSVLSKEGMNSLKQAHTIIIIAGKDSEVASIRTIVNQVRSCGNLENEKDVIFKTFVMVVSTSKIESIEGVDTICFIPEATPVTLRQFISDVIKIINEQDVFQNGDGESKIMDLKDFIRGEHCIAVLGYSSCEDDGRASKAADKALHKLMANGVALSESKLFLCVTGGKDFDAFMEYETDEIADIIKSKTGKAPFLKCSKRENGMDGRLRVTVVAVLEEK